jgi:hypothetical protein
MSDTPLNGCGLLLLKTVFRKGPVWNVWVNCVTSLALNLFDSPWDDSFNISHVYRV